MSGNKDNPDIDDQSDDASDDKSSGGVDLSSYLKDKTPTMSRILQEAEARTAALAAGNGAGDETDLEFVDAEEEPEASKDDAFVIVEEESLDISFDSLDIVDLDGDEQDEDAEDFEDELEELEDFDLEEVGPLETSDGAHTISLDDDEPDENEINEDGVNEDWANEDEDLGPPLPDLSAPVDGDEADAEDGATNDDDEDVIADLPDIEFIDDEDVAVPATAQAETPEHAEPLNLADFDDSPEAVPEKLPELEQETDPPQVAASEDISTEPLKTETAARSETEILDPDGSDLEMVDPAEIDAPAPIMEPPPPVDEFAGWDEEDDDDLGPPLPDLSAPAEDDGDAAGDAQSAQHEEIDILDEIDEDTADKAEEPESSDDDSWPTEDDIPLPEPIEPENSAAEDELTLEIEGLEFRPGDTIDERAVVVEARGADGDHAAEDRPAEEGAAIESAEPESEPESAPGIAEKAKPVSVQEALMAAIELHRVGDLEGAAHGYEMLVRRYPNSAAGWINLGIVLRRIGKLDAALVCLRRGVMLNPKDGAAWSNLGNALRAANYLQDAKRAQIKAISLTPGAAQIHYNMGLVTRDFGELADADSCFRRADLLGYANPDLAWDRSLNQLLSGNLEEGFAAYEARWTLPDTQQRYPDLPRWQGDRQKDKTVVIHAEQGLGDSLQFCRYVPTLKSRVGKLIFEVQPQLVDLLNASPLFRGVEIHAREQALIEADMQMPLLSTPILLPLGESVLPGRDPYLNPPPDGPRIRESLPGPRIGIAWAGKPTHKNDANRSAGLSAFTALFDVLNARFFSLQVGPTQSQIRNLALNSVVQDLSPAIRSFADTASLLQDLDLVVTVDTSVAHLAGAMGKQVWVVLPFAPDWRWQLRRQDSPWYPSMRLFRQTSPGDWDGVFMQVRGALDEWMDARGDPSKG